MTSSVVYPFNVYDLRKTHGYIYSPVDHLYHNCNRHNIRKHAGRVVDISEWTDKDLRGIMDFSSDTIPIAVGKILTPSSGEIRLRNEYDYFTYEIDAPTVKGLDSVHLLSQYFSQLIPKKDDYELLRSFLRTSLIRYTENSYIVIRGSPEANSNLINILLKLDPIIKRGRHTLFCEISVNKITLDEIHQARIVLCDIGYRTIRPSHSFIGKPYKRPVQYHGIVFQTQILQPINDLKCKTVNIVHVPTDEMFTPGDILAWILS